MERDALHVHLLFCHLGTTVFVFFYLFFVLIEVEARGQQTLLNSNVDIQSAETNTVLRIIIVIALRNQQR